MARDTKPQKGIANTQISIYSCIHLSTVWIVKAVVASIRIYLSIVCTSTEQTIYVAMSGKLTSVKLQAKFRNLVTTDSTDIPTYYNSKYFVLSTFTVVPVI